MAHLRDAAARDHNRHAHLRRLDDHLAGQAAGGVENIVRNIRQLFALHPLPARDGVDGVVAAHVFNKQQHFGVIGRHGKQRAGMHRTGRLVGGLLEPDAVDQAVKLSLRDPGIGRQNNLVNLVHQSAKHAALTAAGGDHAFGGFFLDVGDAVPRLDGSRAHIPVHRDGLDVAHLPDQTLVTQVTKHQQLWVRTQSHQGHQLALVDVNRQCALRRNRYLLRFTVFVDGVDFAGQRRAGLCQVRQWHLGSLTQKGPTPRGPALCEKTGFRIFSPD